MEPSPVSASGVGINLNQFDNVILKCSINNGLYSCSRVESDAAPAPKQQSISQLSAISDQVMKQFMQPTSVSSQNNTPQSSAPSSQNTTTQSSAPSSQDTTTQSSAPSSQNTTTQSSAPSSQNTTTQSTLPSRRDITTQSSASSRQDITTQSNAPSRQDTTTQSSPSPGASPSPSLGQTLRDRMALLKQKQKEQFEGIQDQTAEPNTTDNQPRQGAGAKAQALKAERDNKKVAAQQRSAGIKQQSAATSQSSNQQAQQSKQDIKQVKQEWNKEVNTKVQSELQKGQAQIDKTNKTLKDKIYCVNNSTDKKCRKSGFEEMFNHSIVPANSHAYTPFTSTSQPMSTFSNTNMYPMTPDMYLLKTRGGNAW